MKFGLVCFGLLFIGAELWQWLAELGSQQPAGAVLILGGMGLAAVSNAAHLPKVRGAEEDSSKDYVDDINCLTPLRKRPRGTSRVEKVSS